MQRLSIPQLARRASHRRSVDRRAFSQSACRRASYGFIGLGAMGLPMARNLRSKLPRSDGMIVYDVNVKASEAFISGLEDGETARIAKSVEEVSSAADIVLTVLPEPSHVRKVYDSMLTSVADSPNMPEPRLFIDCSTIDPITSRSVAAKVRQHGGIMVDAPMSGGVVGARASKLTFMLGAAPSIADRATAVLNLMGARVVHLGDQGAGLSGKLANNYLLALNNIATAEAMSMGIQWGLDPKALAGMINSATGKCWPSEVNNPVPGIVETAPASRGYEGGFGISLMRKDLGLALASAKEYSVKNGLGEYAMAMYKAAEHDPRCEGKDFSSIYRWLEGPNNETQLP